ncbi:hypothetical protein [Roseofilum sp. Guam]|uniref:hypothetical protein n=1 Tax=Roseofilum sp. Guam TaxID=2821502 RepID=UPI001B189127|nr:hypothetical protein [Roseofilum sp. Guam]MBP0030819.1 hypothetical protein [Roseofilum sp. Guam]
MITSIGKKAHVVIKVDELFWLNFLTAKCQGWDLSTEQNKGAVLHKITNPTPAVYIYQLTILDNTF